MMAKAEESMTRLTIDRLDGGLFAPPDELARVADRGHRRHRVWGFDFNTRATYGPRLSDAFRRLAYFTSRILKGAKPTDLPIERPTVFELVLNLRTAKQIGLAVPFDLLALADGIIE